MPPSTYYAVLLALVLGVGCGKGESEGKKQEPPKKLIADPIVERAIRKRLEKPTGELTKADLEKVRTLSLGDNKLTEFPKGLEKLTQLTRLDLDDNPDLSKAQIVELHKALPNCKIYHTAKK